MFRQIDYDINNMQQTVVLILKYHKMHRCKLTIHIFIIETMTATDIFKY